MNELTTQNRQLPDNIEDLARFVLIGREKLTAVRAEIRAIKAVELAAEVHEQKLEEAQEIAEAVLDAEAKLGELTSKMEKAQGARTDLQLNPRGGEKSKKQQLADLGITHVERYETIAKHPEEVEKAKKNARETGTIVTRSDVAKQISAKYEDRRQQEARELREAKKRHAEYQERDQEEIADFAAAKQDSNDKRLIFEALKEDISKLESHIRHFAIDITNGKFKASLEGADKMERSHIYSKLREMHSTIVKMEIEVMTDEK